MKLADLEVDAHVTGVEPTVTVKVLDLEKAGAQAVGFLGGDR